VETDKHNGYLSWSGDNLT